MNKPLIATWRPQADQNGYCVDIDGQVQFDATLQLLSLDLERVRNFREHDEDSDRLAIDSGLPAWQTHNGPFEVDVDVDSWLEAHGIIGGRRVVTQEHLDRLREAYNWSEDWQTKRPMRTVEYYRLWDDNTWDTDFIDIPADTPEEALEGVVRATAQEIPWLTDVPAVVGLYCTMEDDEAEPPEDEPLPNPNIE